MASGLNIAFLGMGVMGAPMAGHLVRAGHRVTVHNRTQAKAERFVQDMAREDLEALLAGNAVEAAAGQDGVITCLGDDNDVREVVLAEGGVLAAMNEDALFVDHTTISPATAQQVAQSAADRSVLALDAPVSGGEAGAQKGALAIMCGGSEAAMKAARPILAAYAARQVHVGGPGAGQGAKMVNQVCIAGVLAGLSEGVRLTEAAGLDPDRVFEAISGGAAQSWQMDNRWASMVDRRFDFGFAIDWMRKDLAIALAAAEGHGLALPVTEQVDAFYRAVQAKGGARQDTSALIRHLSKGNE